MSELSQIKAAADLIKTTSDSSMRGVISSQGFTGIKGYTVIGTVRGVSGDYLRKKYIPRLQNLFLQAGVSETNLLMETLNDVAVGEISRGAEKLDTVLNFNDGRSGNLRMAAFSFRYQPETKDYDAMSCLVDTDFTVAPSYMVVRRSESDLFSSDSWEELQPLQTGITGDHVRALYGVVLPQVGTLIDSIFNRQDLPAVAIGPSHTFTALP